MNPRLLILAASLASLAGCNDAPLTPRNCAGDECLDLEAFSAGIQKGMEGQAVGYALSVVSNGLVIDQIGVGNNRTAADGAQAMRSDDRMNVASVNKTVTAIAVLRLLAKRNLTPDSTIAPYLPPGWTRGAGVSTITFRQLLTHTSGLRPATCGGAYFGEDYQSLRNMIATGLNGSAGNYQKGYCYVNGNFALFRIILPYLNGFDGTGVSDMAAATSAAYLAVIRDEVAGPAGLAAPDLRCKPRGGSQPLFYPFPAGNTAGSDFGDWTPVCGGGGLHLSAEDLATLLYRLRNTSDLLTPAQRNEMYDGLLGWQNGFSKKQVKHGTYHSHGGYLWYPAAAGANPDTNCIPGGVGEANTVIMDFSVGVQVVLLVNSRVQSQGCIALLQSIVEDAYEDAWQPK